MDLRVNLGDKESPWWLWIEVKCGDAAFHRDNREAQLQRLRDVAEGAFDEKWRLVLPGKQVGQAKLILEKAQDLGYLIVYPDGEDYSWELYLAYRDSPTAPGKLVHWGSVELTQEERDVLKPPQPQAAATPGTPLQFLQLQQPEEEANAYQRPNLWKEKCPVKRVNLWKEHCRGRYKEIPLTQYSVPQTSAYKVIDAPEPQRLSLSLFYCMARFLEMEGIDIDRRGKVSTGEGLSVSTLKSLRYNLLGDALRKGSMGMAVGMARSPGGVESRRALALAVAFSQVLL